MAELHNTELPKEPYYVKPDAEGTWSDPKETPDLSPPGVLTVTLHDGVGLSIPDHPTSFLDRNPGVDPVAENISALQSYSAAPRGQDLPYAVVELEKSHVFIEASGGSPQDPTWHGELRRYNLDVFRATNVRVRLYLATASVARPDYFLGEGKVMLSTALAVSCVKWLHLQGGTGKLGVGLRYVQGDPPPLESFKNFGGIEGAVQRVCRGDTQLRYALKRKLKSCRDCVASLPRQPYPEIDSAFVAPLLRIYESPSAVHLLSPFISGGHLFYYLQRLQRFDLATAKFYAAELVCAFEYLHGLGVTCHELKPTDILLDSLGHIVLCNLENLQAFSRVPKNAGALEYPAPEQLIDGVHTRAADWWTLGVFLCEMVTGLPPFYAEGTEEVRRKILSGVVDFPESVPQSTKVLLLALLHHDPERRLGAGGASEIKASSFFKDVHWSQLLDRGYEAPFRPREVFMHFAHQVGPSRAKAYVGFSYKSSTFPPPKREDSSDNQTTPTNLDPETFTLDQAVRAGDQKLIKVLIQSTGRLDAIKALGRAVEQGDGAIIGILLDAGVNCDFEEADQPVPHSPDNVYFGWCNFIGSSLEPADFESPLVRAVKLHKPDIARMLLTRGADPNTAFHDLSYPLEHDIPSQAAFKCGRVVQLAANHDNEEMVQLLLDYGASIDMAMPAWHGHQCPPIPRSVYLKMISFLRQQVQRRRDGTI